MFYQEIDCKNKYQPDRQVWSFYKTMALVLMLFNYHVYNKKMYSIPNGELPLGIKLKIISRMQISKYKRYKTPMIALKNTKRT